MNKYIIIYLGGEQPTSPEEAKEHMEKYREWLKSLGDSIVSALNPLKDTHVVSDKGATNGSSTAMSGFTIVQANSLEAVLEMSKTCPFLDIGGTLEVSELMQMGS
ncbi:MAG: YciI family protein [Methylococcaceae bacterium]|nr:YciI family protein [Methylococcaceae bacterium]